MESIQVELNAEYRGQKIEFNEWNNNWRFILDGEQAYSHQELKQVKDYIDRFLKKDFKPFEAIQRGWGSSSYKKVTVTSIDIDGNYWIRDENKKRSKESKGNIFALNEKNLAITKQFDDVLKEISTLKDTLNKLKDKLEPLKKG